MLLRNNPRFQKEYHEFINKIDAVSDPKIKMEAQRLLNELLSEVKRLDHGHQELNFQKQLPDDISQSRNKLTEIRKKLTKILV